MTWDAINGKEAARLSTKLNARVAYGQIDTSENYILHKVHHSEVSEWLIILIYLCFMPLMRQIEKPLGSMVTRYFTYVVWSYGSKTLGKICETTEQKDMTQIGIQL